MTVTLVFVLLVLGLLAGVGWRLRDQFLRTPPPRPRTQNGGRPARSLHQAAANLPPGPASRLIHERRTQTGSPSVQPPSASQRHHRPPWYARRGRTGMLVLAMISMAILALLLNVVGAFDAPVIAAPDTLVVRIAPFVVEGGDARTGVTVAEQLVAEINSRPASPIKLNLERLRNAITTPEEALEIVRTTGANVVIWGTVADGATTNSAALQPQVTWQPHPNWAPSMWYDRAQLALPQHFALARSPINGVVVLPPLLDSLGLLSQGDIEQATEQLSILQRDYGDVLNPELPALLQTLIFWAEGLTDEAITTAQQATESSERAEHWNNLGVVLLDAGRDNDALSAWNRALTLDPNLAQAYTNRGRWLLSQEGAATALPDLQRAVALNDPQALPLLATAGRLTGQLQTARNAASAALRLNASNTAANAERALLVLTNIQTATGRLEWQLEDSPTRSGDELAEIETLIQSMLTQITTARTEALKQATAFGVAGQPALQRLQEMQAQRLERRQGPLNYALLLVKIEQGRVAQLDPPNSFMRFFGWLRGQRSPFQQAATLAGTLQTQTAQAQLSYDLAYQQGRASYLAGNREAAEISWNTATSMTNTTTLSPQPEAVYGLGRILLDQGATASGRNLLEQAITIAPNYLPARRRLLELARTEQRWADTESQLRWFLAQEANLEQSLELAEVLQAQDKLAEAEAVLLPLANQNNDQALAALGALYNQAKRFEAAQVVLDRAIQLNPANPQAYEELATLTLAQPQPDLKQAGDYLQRAIAAAPSRASARVRLAQLLGRQGQPAAAAEQFQAAVEIQSTDPLVYRELGEVLLASGQPAAAADSFRRALRLAPNSHEAHHGLAMAYFAQGRLNEARAEEEMTLRLANNNYTLALVGMGDIELASGDRDAARNMYTTALERDPQIVGAYLGLGKVALAQGVPEVAQEHYRRGLEANPDNIALLLGLGETQLNVNDSAGAEQTYTRIQQIDPSNAAGYAGAGKALWRQGQVDLALQQLTQAVERGPADAESWLLVGDILATRDQFDQALLAYTNAAENRADWYAPRYRRGVLLLENNQAAAAVEDLQATVRLNSEFAQGYYWLGRAYRATGNPVAAERQLRQAVTLEASYYEARFFLGRVLAEQGKGADALGVYQGLLLDAPADNQWRNQAERELNRIQG